MAGSESIPVLTFTVDGARALRPAVTPTIRLAVGVDAGGRAIRSLALTVQVRVAPERRAYDDRDEQRLAELFGAPEQWGQSLRPLPWATLAVNLAPFDGDTSVYVDLPATYDFDVAAAKYLHALGPDGIVPIELLFSGTVFWSGEGGMLRVGRISWEADAAYELPVGVWRDAMDGSFPNEAWLRLSRDSFDRLNAYRTGQGLPTWEAAVERLLGRGMSDPIRDIAEAVLYEGYVLWPYRRSALKNQQRWTFGGTYPRAWSEAQGGQDPWARQAEVLLVAGTDAEVTVELRFLHVVRRQAARLLRAGYEPVDELVEGPLRHLTWDEAAERVVATGRLALSELAAAPRRTPVAVAHGEAMERVGESGALLRSWETIAGELVLTAAEARPGVWRLRARVENASAFAGGSRDEALRRTLVSTHLVFRSHGGELLSLTDPPDGLEEEAQACENDGLWPVLAGARSECNTVLASPIILADFPAVAPESAGDFFDGGEIDELLTLNVLGLTDAEREEMRATDPRTRAILERAEGLSREQFLRMHGTWR